MVAEQIVKKLAQRGDALWSLRLQTLHIFAEGGSAEIFEMKEAETQVG
jgi:hypothetical protein